LTGTRVKGYLLLIAWADESITVKINQGIFAANSKAFLFIVDKDGTVNSQGFPVMFVQENAIKHITPDNSNDVNRISCIS
jgi:hypothetical protein